MKYRIYGDIHGSHRDMQFNIINDKVENSIQVGDFGIGFANDYWHDKVNTYQKSGNHRFIRGNHDDPQRCKSMHGYIPDGTVENNMMFIGGAWSIDANYRLANNWPWWPDEELSIEDMYILTEVYAFSQPEIMITHDGPGNVTAEMFLTHGKARYLTRTGQWFDSLFEIHKPKLWLFGHWHTTKVYEIDGTKFICVGEMDYVDIDTETLEIRYHPSFSNEWVNL